MCLNETYSKSYAGKLLSDTLPIHNVLKQGDALWPLHCNFASSNQVRLKLHAALQPLVYADDVSFVGESMHIKNKNTEVS
jgi:hypothetical protein